MTKGKDPLSVYFLFYMKDPKLIESLCYVQDPRIHTLMLGSPFFDIEFSMSGGQLVVKKEPL